jgi:hypothetical protein
MSLFLLIIIYKLLIDVREVKTRLKLIKHIDTEKNQPNLESTQNQLRFLRLKFWPLNTQLKFRIIPGVPKHAVSN